MNNAVGTKEATAANSIGTYDFSPPVELVKAIDQAMRHYFEADRWLVTRNRLFPGLRTPA